MSLGGTKGGKREAKSWAIRHADELRSLVESDEPRPKRDLPEETQDIVIRGAINQAILRVKKEYVNGQYRYRYELDPRIEALVRDHLESMNTLPCDHSGIRNLGDGEYSCTVDACDAVYERETVEEVYDIE